MRSKMSLSDFADLLCTRDPEGRFAKLMLTPVQKEILAAYERAGSLSADFFFVPRSTVRDAVEREEQAFVAIGWDWGEIE